MNGANNATDDTVTSETLTIQLGKAAAQNMLLTIKSFDPRTAIKTAARMEVVNPATGAIITRAGAPVIQAQNMFTAAGAESGGAAITNLVGGGMTAANVALSLGINQLGNDNHNNASTPFQANRRLRETQAFGSAVLFTGNALNAAPQTAITGGSRINIQSRANSDYSLIQLDLAISAVSAERAKYGAYISRLESAGDNLTNVSRHQEQSRSRIADADYAVETSELSRTTIIAQASTAMLAQANAAKQTVLTLLQ